MTLQPGTKLGPYEIVAPIGAGGMGEVYRARDPRIGRDVAVKVLPAAFSADPDRLRRFEQEARSAGVLNHPNILAIYDIGAHEGAPYIVSELLDGEILRDRIKIGTLPGRKSIEIGTQIAHGLAAAHDHGIVHRDLKPENLFVTKDGRVKILDFGLAKLTAPDREGAAKPDARTLPADTGPGAVWGTVGYMSPEQVRGNPVDHRSDIFAFGAILYEMLSGRRAFHGDSPADTMSAILKEDPPDLTETVEGISPGLERVVRHCLEKSPGERFQSARDLAFNLEAISGMSGSRPAVALPAARLRRPLILAGASLVALAIVASTLWLPGALRWRRPANVMRVTLEPPGDKFGRERLLSMSISPDGRWVVFGVPDTSGPAPLWLRPLNSSAAAPLTGTKGAVFTFWSPDSKNIAFFSEGKLRRVPVDGGPARVICDAPNGRGGAWNRQGVIVFAPDATGGLYRVSAEGGQPVPVTVLDSTRHQTAHRFPCFLPDGRHFLYVAIPGHEGGFDNFLGSLDSKTTKAVLKASDAVAYAEPGLLVFSRDDLLMAQRFDARRGKVQGEPTIMAEAPNLSITVGLPVASVSQTGIASYLARRVAETTLRWYTLAGDPLGTVPAPAGRYTGISISPDGRRAVLVRRMSSADTDLWLIDFERGTSSRLTFDPGAETSPVWSPDGSRIVFSSDRKGGVNNLYVMPSEGGEAELLYRSEVQFKNPVAWSLDGRYIIFNQLEPQTLADLWILPTMGDRRAEPYLHTRFIEDRGEPSPDGHWLAYTSNESGRFEAYVQSFPRPGRKQQISTDGSGGPFWRSDGKELFWGFWRGGSLTIMSAAVHSDSTILVSGTPRVVSVWPAAKLQGNIAVDWTPNAQRILIAKETGEPSPPVPTLILNWPELTKAKR